LHIFVICMVTLNKIIVGNSWKCKFSKFLTPRKVKGRQQIDSVHWSQTCSMIASTPSPIADQSNDFLARKVSFCLDYFVLWDSRPTPDPHCKTSLQSVDKSICRQPLSDFTTNFLHPWTTAAQSLSGLYILNIYTEYLTVIIF
jgi:hypothetical protein